MTSNTVIVAHHLSLFPRELVGKTWTKGFCLLAQELNVLLGVGFKTRTNTGETTMNQMLKRTVIPLSFAFLANTAFADHSEANSALQDAWLDGKLGTVVVLNKHLNPLRIETDVVDGKAIVTGKVDSPVQKSLMTELALSVEGIKSVDNRLQVTSQERHEDEEGIEPVSTMLDASITTAISTKLLLKPEIDSSEIDVDTDKQNVILRGTVKNDVESDLVEQIALNTFEVDSVINRLEVLN